MEKNCLEVRGRTEGRPEGERFRIEGERFHNNDNFIHKKCIHYKKGACPIYRGGIPPSLSKLKTFLFKQNNKNYNSWNKEQQ